MRLGIILLLGAVVCGVVAVARPSAAQQCDDFNECTGAGQCDANGICRDGQPVANGTQCSAPASGECLQNPTCVDGECAGGTPLPTGSPCHLLNSPCFTAGACFVVPPIPGVPPVPPVCFDSRPIDCLDDGNPLTFEFCNPEVGHCQSVNICVSDTCMARQVVGSTCQETPRNNGAACDDGNECTTDTHCSDGRCVNGSGPVSTATPTHMPTPTPPQQVCTGDCGVDNAVTVDEIITMLTIANNPQSLPVCPNGDGNGDHVVTSDDLIAAVNSALNGCG